MSAMEKIKKIRYMTIGGREYDLLMEIRIDKEDLDKMFTEHPEKTLFWGRLRARENARLRRLEDELQELEKIRFRQFWELYDAKGVQFSDSLVWSEVRTENTVVEKRKEVRRAKAKSEALKSVCDAFEHRKSSLINLGAMYRKEREQISTRRRE